MSLFIGVVGAYLVALSLMNLLITARPDMWPAGVERTVDRLQFILRRRDPELIRQMRREHPTRFIVGSVAGMLVGLWGIYIALAQP